MPAEKKKKTQSRKKTKKSSATKKKQEKSSQKERPRGVIAAFLLTLAGLLLAALGFFRLGLLGRLVFGFFALFAGYFAWIFLALLFLALLGFLFLEQLPAGKKRLALSGGILLALFLFFGVIYLNESDPFALPREIGANLGSVLSGESLYPIGLLNGALAALLIVVASKPGAILISLLLFAIFLLIALWPLLQKALKSYKENKSLQIDTIENSQLSTKPSKEDIEQIFSQPEKKRKSRSKEKEDGSRKEKRLPEIISSLPDQIEISQLEPIEDSLLYPKPGQDLSRPAQAKSQSRSAAGLQEHGSESVIEQRQEKEGQTGEEPYLLPDSSLLLDLKSSDSSINEQYAKKSGARLLDFLEQFKIPAELERIQIGPSVTQFELHLGMGVRVNTITNLQNDIKMALAAKDIRIEAPIPGKSAIGIEIPNARNVMVSMKEMIFSLPKKHGPLTFCLGRDLSGTCIYGNLERMPHLLIAGATGSGKSVCVNSIISSILLLTRPDEVKLVLIDPKKVELTPFEEVPHLLSPVITEAALANMALKVIVAMMDQRYGLFEEEHVRNIAAYNKKAKANGLPALPHIVVIIDELADLMLLAAKEVEQSIQRITQLARAAGIHLVVATQRPSVNVLTGVIKANIPSRIAFAVSSSVDSRTILDQSGAERLLGHGDMLFLDNGESYPRRIQGVFIQDEEVNAITEFIKQHSSPHYEPAFLNLELPEEEEGESITISDPLYEQVKHFVIEARKASTSLIQRKFSIGYARAARLMDALEQEGVIGPARGSKAREVFGE